MLILILSPHTELNGREYWIIVGVVCCVFINKKL